MTKVRCFWTIALALHIDCSVTGADQDSKFYFNVGSCQLPSDPHESTSGILTPIGSCLRANINHDMAYASKIRLLHATRADGDLSIHVGHYNSLFASGYVERTESVEPDKLPYSLTKTLRNLSYTLGNLALYPLALTVGRQSPSFGINHTPLIGLNNIWNPRQFWDGASPGIALRVDNMKSIAAELSLNRDFDDDDRFVSLRLMYDMAYKAGVRCVVSFQGKDTGERKGGLAALAMDHLGNLLQIEWVRIRSTPDGKSDSFQQLVRIAFEESREKNIRVFAQYDDIRRVARQVIFGSHMRFLNNLHTKTAVAYRKSSDQARSQQWFFALGIGFTL